MPDTNEEDERIVLLCLFPGKNSDHGFVPQPVLLSPDGALDSRARRHAIPLPVEVQDMFTLKYLKQLPGSMELLAFELFSESEPWACVSVRI